MALGDWRLSGCSAGRVLGRSPCSVPGPARVAPARRQARSPHCWPNAGCDRDRRAVGVGGSTCGQSSASRPRPAADGVGARGYDRRLASQRVCRRLSATRGSAGGCHRWSVARHSGSADRVHRPSKVVAATTCPRRLACRLGAGSGAGGAHCRASSRCPSGGGVCSGRSGGGWPGVARADRGGGARPAGCQRGRRLACAPARLGRRAGAGGRRLARRRGTRRRAGGSAGRGAS